MIKEYNSQLFVREPEEAGEIVAPPKTLKRPIFRELVMIYGRIIGQNKDQIQELVRLNPSIIVCDKSGGIITEAKLSNQKTDPCNPAMLFFDLSFTLYYPMHVYIDVIGPNWPDIHNELPFIVAEQDKFPFIDKGKSYEIDFKVRF